MEGVCVQFKTPRGGPLEYLKKQARERLAELRQSDPAARLPTALLAVARDFGFSIWRALKAEVEQRHAKSTTLFFEACAKGDIESLRGFLADDASLVRATAPMRPTRAGRDCTPQPKRARAK